MNKQKKETKAATASRGDTCLLTAQRPSNIQSASQERICSDKCTRLHT